MKNINLTIAVILWTSCSIFAQSKIQVPYFKTLSGNEICGSQNCIANNANTWATIYGGYLYDGDASKIFGRKYKTYGTIGRIFGKRGGIFENSSCASRLPNENEYKELRKGNLQGILDITKKTDFESKVNADLTKIINQYVNVNPTVKADLLAELKKTVDLKSNATVDLEYRIIQLEQEFLDNEIENCIKSLSKGEKVIVGLSVLTVAGTWNSNTLKEVFANFEANAGAFKALDAEAKSIYEQSKQKVLTAKYEPFSMIFNVTYRL